MKGNHKISIIIFMTIFIIYILFIFFNNTLKKSVQENFDDNTSWNQSDQDYQAQNGPLNKNQIDEVKGIATQVSKDQLSNLIAAQSPLLTGPQGPVGPQGPPGTQLIASGRIVNKKGSFDSKTKGSHMIPNFILTRTEGTNPKASLAFMDNVTPFVSYQRWGLDINNQIKNRYDGTCLTMSNNQDNIYMDKCDINNPLQKWNWDNTNRIISTSLSTNNNLKCLGLSSSQTEQTTSIPGCTGENCLVQSAKNYMVVKDCAINNINDDEIWDFI